MRKGLVFLPLLLISFLVSAQGIRTVSGSYIYVIPDSQSYTEAQTTALQRAKIQILADTFGTVMDVSTTTNISETGASTQALSLSSVRGEWLETIGKPKISRLFDGDQLAIKVEITGRVREIVSASTDFSAKILCGTPDIRFQSDRFRSGDNFYLWFQAPEDGYLAVYLYDGQDDVYCLLPYRRQETGAYSVKGGSPYLFFSEELSDGTLPSILIDEYVLKTDKALELNKIYVIYSPNRFSKALDNYREELPRELSYSDFQVWLSKVRTEDRLLSIKQYNVTIGN